MKNNIEYYQHFTNSHEHPKFKMLRIEYGWEGEGRFWALNNMIGQSEDCNLDLSRKYNKSTIASDLNMDLTQFEDFIEYLQKDCNLIKLENGKITTNITQENLKTANKKRARNKKAYERISANFQTADRQQTANCQTAESDFQTAENIQTKLNKTKENKTKENNPPLSPPFGGESETKKPVKCRKILPKDFILTTKMRDYCQKYNRNGKTPEQIFEDFSQFHFNKGSKMKDWVMAWQYWCRNSYTRNKQSQNFNNRNGKLQYLNRNDRNKLELLKSYEDMQNGKL